MLKGLASRLGRALVSAASKRARPRSLVIVLRDGMVVEDSLPYMAQAAIGAVEQGQNG